MSDLEEEAIEYYTTWHSSDEERLENMKSRVRNIKKRRREILVLSRSIGRTMAEQKKMEKETAIEEARMDAVVEDASRLKKSCIDNSVFYDAMFAVETIGMDAESVKYYALHRKGGLERLHARKAIVGAESATLNY